MASPRISIPAMELTPEGLASAYGTSLIMILAALRNPIIWEVIGGGPHSAVSLSPAGKAELKKNLNTILSSLMSRVQSGDVAAAQVAVGVSAQLATLTE